MRDWRLMRQDDNGNAFVVHDRVSRDDAEHALEVMESHGHKQLYWIEQAPEEAKPAVAKKSFGDNMFLKRIAPGLYEVRKDMIEAYRMGREAGEKSKTRRAMPRTLIIATGNKNKVAEMIPHLKGLLVSPVSISSYLVEHARLASFDFNPVEDGDTLDKNASIKAMSAARLSGHWSLSDDTGLFIDALDGRPGVYSARYAGEGCPFEENVKKIMAELGDVPDGKRGATFSCVIAFYRPGIDIKPMLFRGDCRGTMTRECQSIPGRGFGYDPIFRPDSTGLTFGQMSDEEKNEVSHRGLAMKAFVAWANEHKDEV